MQNVIDFLTHVFQGSEDITTYTFNTHTAKHTFCKICGVQSFYTPRSNPDGFGGSHNTTTHTETHSHTPGLKLGSGETGQ